MTEGLGKTHPRVRVRWGRKSQQTVKFRRTLKKQTKKKPPCIHFLCYLSFFSSVLLIVFRFKFDLTTKYTHLLILSTGKRKLLKLHYIRWISFGEQPTTSVKCQPTFWLHLHTSSARGLYWLMRGCDMGRWTQSHPPCILRLVIYWQLSVDHALIASCNDEETRV